MKMRQTLFTIAILTVLMMTTMVTLAQDSDDTTSNPDSADVQPVELTTELCEDASLMPTVMQSMGNDGSSPSYGEVNPEQIRRMVQEPTEGPFYMVNLIEFRDQAEYADGRETDLTGQEANALYSPVEFLVAIGAFPVFVGNVTNDISGEESIWDEVAMVRYPCPLATFAMSAQPEFQDRAIHKSAGLENSTIMVTHLRELDEFDRPDTQMSDDTAFELVQVVRYHNEAQYVDDSDPTRSGQDAMDVYADSVLEIGLEYGIYPKARLEVQGVYIGDGQEWHEVWVYHIPSQDAYEAFLADATVIEAQYHYDAAVDDAYELVVNPMVSMIPN